MMFKKNFVHENHEKVCRGTSEILTFVSASHFYRVIHVLIKFYKAMSTFLYIIAITV